MDQARVMTLLAKLDALAANPGTPAEGDAARRRAAAIREKYGVQVTAGRPAPVLFQFAVYSNGAYQVTFQFAFH